MKYLSGNWGKTDLPEQALVTFLFVASAVRIFEIRITREAYKSKYEIKQQIL
jgi:hypothetical protein